jgi:ATP-dependent Clp protease ATP-binding subunit ClpA
MTRDRRSKRAIRSRMAQTGEKYTAARRALVGSGGRTGSDAGEPGPPIAWPDDSLGWFTDQAYNAILLADDEARMLSHAGVEPEHLLLAAARDGNVERLLANEGTDASAIHAALLRIRGLGHRVELRPRRSAASEGVLRRAVAEAAARGVLGPSTEHLLIALGEQELSAQILAELGIGDVEALVDATYPPTRPPIDRTTLQKRAAQLADNVRAAPSPGAIPPVFERFTPHARDAINGAIEYARKADEPYVEPIHLLLAVLGAKAGVVATLRSRHGWQIPPGDFGGRSCSRSTDIFSPDARCIVAEDVLIVAERVHHGTLTTGHILIAILERPDARTSEFVSSLPDAGEIIAEVTGALPGEESS